MPTVAELLLAFVALYPVCTAALWMAGGLLFRLLDEPASAQEPEGGWPGVSVLIPAYNEESVIATSVSGGARLRLPGARGARARRRLHRRHGAAAREAVGADRRCRVIRDPVNRGKADRLNARPPRGAARARRRHRRRHARPSRGAQAARGAHAPLAADRGRRRRAARHQPRPAAAGDAGAGGGVDHRPDPPHPVADGTRRRRRRRPRAVPPRPRARRRRLRPADGHRGHRPDLEAAARRLADRLRAARARRHAGAVDAARPVGAAHALGARPGRGAARPPRRGVPLAQPPHVAARPRVARVADLGRRARPRRSSSSCSAPRSAARTLFGLAFAWGIAIAHRRDGPAGRRALARAQLRPDDPAGVPRRGGVSARLLADRRPGGPALADRSPWCAVRARSASCGTSRASGSAPVRIASCPSCATCAWRRSRPRR